MEKVYGYIRVSTVKQGKGVSLIEQKDAIEAYTKRNNLSVVRWFKELETAAKGGRPVFSEMMRLLKRGKASGVVMHKIDRSARNMSDWAELTEMADNDGVQVHFVHESVNLKRDNDRLSADMQAVVASHYIRNLRQETIKGLYGRLKQGVYPFKAPLGYIDTGAGNPKKIDPIKGPLVKKIFTLYITEQWGIAKLASYMNELGLTNSRGGKITKNSISRILNNHFYMGLMKVAGQTFQGKHKSLVSTHEFEQVQDILSGKRVSRAFKHDFVFRKLFKCSVCNRSLIGEVQKGINYYRCHSKHCPVKCIREDVIERELGDLFSEIELSEKECSLLKAYAKAKLSRMELDKEKIISSLILQINHTQNSIDTLLDLLLDGNIDKETYNCKKEKLLSKLQELNEQKNSLDQKKDAITNIAMEFIELAKSLYSNYEKATKEKKRYMVKKITSNRLIYPKSVDIQLFPEFAILSNRTKLTLCGLDRDDVRTFVTKPVKKTAMINNNTNQKNTKAVKITNEEILTRVADQLIEGMLK